MERFTRAEAFAPASMGNVGIGFDILGLAYKTPGDVVIAEWGTEAGVRIKAIDGDEGRLPLDPDKNVASVAVAAYLEMINEEASIDLTIRKGLPLSSGLGGSAASSVAAVFAVNALFGSPLEKGDLIPACLEGEALVSGRHLDNIAPCLFGGISLINGNTFHDIRALPTPDLYFALIKPAIDVPTKAARAVLPAEIDLKTMIHQTGHVALLIDALYRGDIEQLAYAMESDQVVEKARFHLIPHLADARFEAKRLGALNLVISGSGPTLCAVCTTQETAERVSRELSKLYQAFGLDSLSLATGISQEGVVLTNRV